LRRYNANPAKNAVKTRNIIAASTIPSILSGPEYLFVFNSIVMILMITLITAENATIKENPISKIPIA